jgi:hypothetical protein
LLNLSRKEIRDQTDCIPNNWFGLKYCLNKEWVYFEN